MLLVAGGKKVGQNSQTELVGVGDIWYNLSYRNVLQRNSVIEE